MGTSLTDVSQLLLAYDPDFVELETAPLLLDDTHLQGAVPAVLGGAGPLSEEICPDGRYEDFIANLRTFLREQKIVGGFDWNAVVITGPGLSEIDESEEDVEALAQTGGTGDYQNEFDSDEDEDEDGWLFARRPVRGAPQRGSKSATEPAEDWPAEDDIDSLEGHGFSKSGGAINNLIVDLPLSDEVVGAMDETEAEAEPPEAEPPELIVPTTWDALTAEDPGWGSAPAPLLQYIVPAESFAESSLSLSE